MNNLGRLHVITEAFGIVLTDLRIHNKHWKLFTIIQSHSPLVDDSEIDARLSDNIYLQSIQMAILLTSGYRKDPTRLARLLQDAKPLLS